MRIIILLSLTLSIHHPLWSQSLYEVDQKVLAYSDLSLNKPEKLAQQIKADFATELERARAIYSWLAMNVAYDLVAYRQGAPRFSYSYKTEEERLMKAKQHKQKIAVQTFKNKKAVCEGYANLFQYLCELTGVECVTITGYSKTSIRNIGRDPSGTDHAWNAVKVDNQWMLMDATWGAGYLNGNEFVKKFSPLYFDTPPQRFALTHYPADTQWLLTDLSKKKFVNNALFYSTYLESGIDIELPKKGTLEVSANKEIIIKIKSEQPLTDISYNFSTDKYTELISFRQKGNHYFAKLTAPKRKASTLTLYYKNQGMVVYKLKY